MAYADDYELVLKYGAADNLGFAHTIAGARDAAIRTRRGTPEEIAHFNDVGFHNDVFADRLADEGDPREAIVRQNAASYRSNLPGSDHMAAVVGVDPHVANFRTLGYNVLGRSLVAPDGTHFETVVHREINTGRPVVHLTWTIPTPTSQASFHGYFHPDEAVHIVRHVAPEHADRLAEGIARSLEGHRPDPVRF